MSAASVGACVFFRVQLVSLPDYKIQDLPRDMPSLSAAARLTNDVVDGGIAQLRNEAAFLLSQIHELKHLQQQAVASTAADGVEVKPATDGEEGGETSGADLHAEIVRVQKIHAELALAIEALREKYSACKEKLADLSKFYGDEGFTNKKQPPKPKPGATAARDGGAGGGGGGASLDFETGLLTQSPFETLSAIVNVFRQTLNEIQSNPRKYSVILVAQELRNADLSERTRFLKERIEGAPSKPFRQATGPTTKPSKIVRKDDVQDGEAEEQFRKCPTFTSSGSTARRWNGASSQKKTKSQPPKKMVSLRAERGSREMSLGDLLKASSLGEGLMNTQPSVGESPKAGGEEMEDGVASSDDNNVIPSENPTMTEGGGAIALVREGSIGRKVSGTTSPRNFTGTSSTSSAAGDAATGAGGGTGGGGGGAVRRVKSQVVSRTPRDRRSCARSASIYSDDEGNHSEARKHNLHQLSSSAQVGASDERTAEEGEEGRGGGGGGATGTGSCSMTPRGRSADGEGGDSSSSSQHPGSVGGSGGGCPFEVVEEQQCFCYDGSRRWRGWE